MENKRVKKITLMAFCAALAVMLGSGCKTEMPKPSGFLTDYSHLKSTGDSTWQYVDASALAKCDTFVVPPVKLMVSDYWGSSIPAAQRDQLADIFRQKVIYFVGKRYKVVNAPTASSGEIRVAITRVYKIGNSLAVGVEAEIVDPTTHQQLAAVSGVKIGPPEVSISTNARSINDPSDTGTFMASWWTKPSADELLNRWSDQIRKIIDTTHGK